MEKKWLSSSYSAGENYMNIENLFLRFFLQASVIFIERSNYLSNILVMWTYYSPVRYIEEFALKIRKKFQDPYMSSTEKRRAVNSFRRTRGSPVQRGEATRAPSTPVNIWSLHWYRTIKCLDVHQTNLRSMQFRFQYNLGGNECIPFFIHTQTIFQYSKHLRTFFREFSWVMIT